MVLQPSHVSCFTHFLLWRDILARWVNIFCFLSFITWLSLSLGQNKQLEDGTLDSENITLHNVMLGSYTSSGVIKVPESPKIKNLLKLFVKLLQHCFAVKLQKCSEDYKTSPDFPSAWRRANSVWISTFGWTFSLLFQPFSCAFASVLLQNVNQSEIFWNLL